MYYRGVRDAVYLYLLMLHEMSRSSMLLDFKDAAQNFRWDISLQRELHPKEHCIMTHPCCVEQAPRHPEEPHKEAHHGRRSGVSPNRRRVTAAAAETLDTLPTVKEMHLQRVATMAAAAATAQQINADVESHEQFAKELRSYRSHRSQGVGGGQRRVTKPSWETDLGTGGSFGAEYPPSGPGNCYIPQ